MAEVMNSNLASTSGTSGMVSVLCGEFASNIVSVWLEYGKGRGRVWT